MGTHRKPVRRREGRIRVWTAVTSLLTFGALTAWGVASAATGPPELELSVDSGTVGSTVGAHGSGFKPRFNGVLSFAGQQVSAFRTDSAGTFSSKFTIPVSSRSGTVDVSAQTKSLSATRSFTVTSATSSPSPSATSSPSPTATSSPSPTSSASASPTVTSSPSPSSTSSFAGVSFYVDKAGVDTNPGTSAAPVRTVSRGVALAVGANAKGEASRVVVGPGTYRESVTLGAGGTSAPMVIEGYGATLTGADLFTGWSAQGDGSYLAPWPYKWGTSSVPSGWSTYWNADGNGYKRDILRRSETFYVDGVPLRGVLSAQQLVAGTFYVDESAATVRLRLPAGVSMSSARVEAGMRASVLSVNGRQNVTVRGLAIERSRGSIQSTAVTLANSSGLTLQDVTLAGHAYTAFGAAYVKGLTVTNSRFDDNGVNGFVCFRSTGLAMTDTTVVGNNWRGWPAEHKGWDSVMKFSGCRDVTAKRLRVTDNWGNGFWLDSDNKRVVLQDSLIARNQLKGIYLENNQGPIQLVSNRICDNVFAGLADAQSDRVSVQDNQIFRNTSYNVLFTGTYAGQQMTDWQTGEVTTQKTLYWRFTGNLVSGSGSAGWLWWHTDYNAPGAWAQTRNTMTAFDNNNWYHSGRTTAYRLPQGNTDYPTFRTDIRTTLSTAETNSHWTTTTLPTCN
jgi:hypothetical protein